MEASKIAIRGTTQEHLDVEDIKDDLVILKDGSCCLIVATTSINFELLSEREQEATVYAYAGLLNSLTFAIQIIIRSQRKDISSYINLLNEAENRETKAAIKEQIRKYRQFISDIVQKNEVLDKKAYIVIPMSALELGVSKTITASFKPRKKLPFEKSYILEKAKAHLYPKRDHILRLLGRLGLKGRQLTTPEIIQLFFNIYNAESPGQRLTESEQYETPIVQSAFISPPATFRPPTPPLPTREEINQPPVQSVPSAPAPSVTASPQGQPTMMPAQPAPAPPTPQNRPGETNIQDQINHLVKQSVTQPNPNLPASSPANQPLSQNIQGN